MRIFSFLKAWIRFAAPYMPGYSNGLVDSQFCVDVDLLQVEGKMKVARATRDQDPNIILRAMDVLELLSRSTIRVLDCSFQYDIIKIGNQEGGICNMYGITKEQFLARRNLLAGYVLKGNTIVVIDGSLQGINIVRRIVEDCIAHDVPPLPRAQLMKKKTQQKKDEINKVTSELMINLEGMRI
ncbi:uncharacterized protein LOC121049140 [Rosa chinensis]|uniref:uncharacterized protein LOC121049140 n=1 Tax=Rosa chinensis TaxID=74649 RepID=UPI001AD8F73B|nr:uncharacterized protein LOC121049140 [Rosa chinensis]